jgi:hypothetical protein
VCGMGYGSKSQAGHLRQDSILAHDRVMTVHDNILLQGMAARQERLPVCKRSCTVDKVRMLSTWSHPRPSYEPRQGESGSRCWSASQLLVSGGWHSIEFLLDHLLQSPHYAQVWVDVAFFLPVENLLTIHIYFEPAIRAGGERDRYIARKGTKELVRHPRGGCVMFSSDAVHDVN